MGKPICIIPARKGSKRIKNKNKKIFINKPIIEYVINTCLESNLFEKIIVATDDVDIMTIVDKYQQVSYFKRSEQNANDAAPLADIIEEVLRDMKIRNLFGCCVLPTAVFTSREDLISGFDKIQSDGVDSVAAFLKYRYPVQRAVRLGSDLKVHMLNPDHRWTRTQDLIETYHDAGQFYWFRTSVGLKGDNKYGVLLNKQYAIDIDEREDWNLAQHLYTL